MFEREISLFQQLSDKVSALAVLHQTTRSLCRFPSTYNYSGKVIELRVLCSEATLSCIRLVFKLRLDFQMKGSMPSFELSIANT